MKHLFVTLALLVGIISHGQMKNSKTAEEANSLLWKITGNGLSKPSYLFGTMHITCDASLDSATRDALENTTQLYLELDMDDPEMQKNMMGGMMMSDGKTMDSMVSDSDFKLLDAYVQEKLGISATMINTMKPFMISAMLIPSLLDCPMQTVEGELMKVTSAQKEEVFGLETVEEQLAVFDKVPYQAQMDDLMKSIKDKFTAGKTEMVKMMEIYKKKDLDAMLKMVNESDSKMTSEFQDVLLANRNKNWIPKIETIAQKEPTFFGVGAAHLPGEHGVIKLLRNKGYKVEPIVSK